MAVDDPGDDVGEVGAGFDAGELTGLDQRSDDGPMFGAAVRGELIMPGVWRLRLLSPIPSILLLARWCWLLATWSTLALAI